ncbi:MAG: hypothetical protein Q6365_016625 [Candidatus Sigynarchaeota archaeon]
MNNPIDHFTTLMLLEHEPVPNADARDAREKKICASSAKTTSGRCNIEKLHYHDLLQVLRKIIVFDNRLDKKSCPLSIKRKWLEPGGGIVDLELN